MAPKTDFSPRGGEEKIHLKLASRDLAAHLSPFPRGKKMQKEIKEVNCNRPREARRKRAGAFATCREKSKQSGRPLLQTAGFSVRYPRFCLALSKPGSLRALKT